MPDYRRARVPGATYFFTVNLPDRSSDLLIREIDLLREAVRATKACYPFHIDAWVVLPEHMHCLWTLPSGDADFALRWKIIKFAFSKRLFVTEPRTTNQQRRRERGIWQWRYWEHLIHDERDNQSHFDYRGDGGQLVDKLRVVHPTAGPDIRKLGNAKPAHRFEPMTTESGLLLPSTAMEDEKSVIRPIRILVSPGSFLCFAW